MRIRKIYTAYCISLCCLCLIAMLLMPFSGSVFDIFNRPLFGFVYEFSRVLLIILLIPVHPILYGITLIHSKQLGKPNSPNSIIFAITAAFHFTLFFSYCWLTGV